ncbi:MAG: LysR substrate-binding domain-containing protein [Proteobacteria bacterium]|nr:LysR substrate-binding domain-containing protein [Pseudomonadota bacterium]
MRQLPPLNALRSFEAAARHSSMSRAAEELFFNHGAISRQIRALEEFMGVALFQRAHRRVVLTEAGETLFSAASAALDLLAAGTSQVKAASRSRTIVVSCLATFTMRWLIPRLYRFKGLHRDVEVRLSASDQPFDFMLDGIDVAIRVGRPPWPAGTKTTPLLVERTGPVCSPGLWSPGGAEARPDLSQFERLHTHTRPLAWSYWLESQGLSEIDPQAGQYFEHYYFLIESALAGLGFAVCPEVLVAGDLASGRLIAPFGFAPDGQSYYISQPATHVSDARTNGFVDWVLAEARGETGRE